MAKKMKKTAKKKTAKKKTAKKSPKKSVSPIENNLLKIGASAPAFSLPSDSGKTLSLKDFSGKKVVLYFYPKDDTPGCTQESCDFRDSFSRVKASGAVVLGVSKDSVASHQKFKTKFSLPFPLLSDESLKMLEAYKVWNEKSMYGRKYMGIDRTTYVIAVDSNGKGKIERVYPKVKVTGHVDEIIRDLSKDEK